MKVLFGGGSFALVKAPRWRSGKNPVGQRDTGCILGARVHAIKWVASGTACQPAAWPHLKPAAVLVAQARHVARTAVTACLCELV
jgi:hypothetical protein